MCGISFLVIFCQRMISLYDKRLRCRGDALNKTRLWHNHTVCTRDMLSSGFACQIALLILQPTLKSSRFSTQGVRLGDTTQYVVTC